ncbi:hypothetical protein PHYPO_G00151110 [Pangasianodon hypophthalmus]|uniref:Uncharacterized protein n=1 Tax=Pangasianodon hypophthalmus TaxID=310915 RepID=A0A5N5K0T1_PANHP|nr:hypothetical protein PHYPO_G00151110 [Pangasianodon hypophthalmus]
MLKFVLLLCVAVAGSNARPLQYNTLRIQNGGWVIGAPQLVQNGQEYMGNFGSAEHHRQDTNAEPQWEVVLAPEHTEKMQDDMNQKVAPTEEHRQGTEPSRRFLVDLNTGLLKEYISEMDRSVEVYNPASNSAFRQGTQNSCVTLVDVRTGQRLPQLSEMQRRAAPLSQFRQGTEYNEALLMELRKAQMIESMETAKVSKQETTHKSVLPELRRQGTEPSRRFLVNPNTGLVKDHVSEMERRISGFYNPASNSAFRQGTQNSRVTLVDTRTGQQLPQMSEMQRRAAPLSQFRQGTEYNEAMLMELRKAQMIESMETAKVSKQETTHKSVLPELRRQGTEPSRRFLVNPNTGLVKDHVSEMERRISGFYNPASNSAFRQGTQNSRVTLVDTRTGQQLPQMSEMQRRAAPLSQFRQGTEYNEAMLMELRKAQMIESMETAKVSKQETTHKSVLPELRRQGTEPSRRFLVNPNTGLVKDHVSEMERRISGFYNPASNSGFRQGTQNSRVTLVDTRTGQQLPQMSEMQRRAAPYGFRQGTEYNLLTLLNLRNAQMIHTKDSKDKTPHTVQDMETNEVFPEFKRGIEYSQAQRQQIMDQHLFQALESNEVDISPPLEEFRHHMDYSYGNVIDRRIMEPSYVKQSDEVSTCQGEVIAGKCYIFKPKLQTFGEAEDVQNW